MQRDSNLASSVIKFQDQSSRTRHAHRNPLKSKEFHPGAASHQRLFGSKSKGKEKQNNKSSGDPAGIKTNNLVKTFLSFHLRSHPRKASQRRFTLCRMILLERGLFKNSAPILLLTSHHSSFQCKPQKVNKNKINLPSPPTPTKPKLKFP